LKKPTLATVADTSVIAKKSMFYYMCAVMLYYCKVVSAKVLLSIKIILLQFNKNVKNK
jgi:hypothetical protein